MDSWLSMEQTHPSWYESLESNGGLAGPLRLDMLVELGEQLLNRLVILYYQRTYDTELCLLAIFDEDGCLLVVYKFHCQIDHSLDDNSQPEPMSTFRAF